MKVFRAAKLGASHSTCKGCALGGGGIFKALTQGKFRGFYGLNKVLKNSISINSPVGEARVLSDA